MQRLIETDSLTQGSPALLYAKLVSDPWSGVPPRVKEYRQGLPSEIGSALQEAIEAQQVGFSVIAQAQRLLPGHVLQDQWSERAAVLWQRSKLREGPLIVAF